VGEVLLNGFSDEGEDAPALLPAGFDDCQDGYHKPTSRRTLGFGHATIETATLVTNRFELCMACCSRG
jgi:hypothetical protein